ncbi:MAG: single-stranded DNA-binding protein [Actinomycetaceae bacterium]|nr:single-stranded DNA-binding protein [Actinomycetaceae bacterium]
MSSWNTASDDESVTVPVPITGKIQNYSADALHVTVRGRTGTAVDLVQLPSGAQTARFRLAVTQRGRDEAGIWHDLETTWYTVKAWNQLADNCARSIFKGHPVIVSGRLKVNQWENSETGARGTELVIVASSIGHDLTHGLTRYFRLRDDEPEELNSRSKEDGREPGERTQVPADAVSPPAAQVQSNGDVSALGPSGSESSSASTEPPF